MSVHKTVSVNRAYERLSAAVLDAEREHAAGLLDMAPYVGRGNTKTGALNEGTSPLVTCSGHARETCGRECYAIWHVDIRLTAARMHHARNTVRRRLDAGAYYEAFFSAAEKAGAVLLRVNETGDFESPSQLAALMAAAVHHPGVRVIGYTRRPELAPLLRELPGNVHVRLSVYRDGVATAPAGVRVAAVDDVRTNCPSQIAADKGRTWTCSQCAACGGGCACASRLVQWFRAH